MEIWIPQPLKRLWDWLGNFNFVHSLSLTGTPTGSDVHISPIWELLRGAPSCKSQEDTDRATYNSHGCVGKFEKSMLLDINDYWTFSVIMVPYLYNFDFPDMWLLRHSSDDKWVGDQLAINRVVHSSHFWAIFGSFSLSFLDHFHCLAEK